MTVASLRNLKDSITCWPTSVNAYDGATFGVPTVIKGRWQDSNVVFRAVDGEEVTSAAIIYLSADVDIGDYLANGDLSSVADPTTIDAYRVRQLNKSTNLRNVETVRKAFV